MSEGSHRRPAKVDMCLCGDVRLVDLAHQACEEMAELAGLSHEEGLNLALAVREGVVNAMTHGSPQDSGEGVRLVIESEPGEVRVTLSDRGPGFDPGKVPDPTADENLLRASGRGLRMIETLVDEVSFDFPASGGTTLILVKRGEHDSRSEGD